MYDFKLSQTEPVSSLPRDYAALLKRAEKKGEPIIFLRRNEPVGALLCWNLLKQLIELKRKAEELGVNVENKTLNTIINSLKSKSFFRGAQVPIVSSYLKFRNAAMHAQWDKIQDADINSLIGFLEPFLIEHFT